jgi:hypothetical protein
LNRIEAYATFFATRRSIAGAEPRVLREDELTDDERAARERLLAELVALRPTAADATPPPTPANQAPPPTPATVISPTWTFADGNTVTIVCAPLSEELQRRMPYADPQAPDYIELHRYADADALVELHGHLRAVNPQIQVHFKLSTDLVADDYTTHLVVLGGVDWNNPWPRCRTSSTTCFRYTRCPRTRTTSRNGTPGSRPGWASTARSSGRASKRCRAGPSCAKTSRTSTAAPTRSTPNAR